MIQSSCSNKDTVARLSFKHAESGRMLVQVRGMELEHMLVQVGDTELGRVLVLGRDKGLV